MVLAWRELDICPDPSVQKAVGDPFISVNNRRCRRQKSVKLAVSVCHDNVMLEDRQQQSKLGRSFQPFSCSDIARQAQFAGLMVLS